MRRLVGAGHEVTLGARTTVALATLQGGRPVAALRLIDDVVGQPQFMGGTLAVDDAAFGNPGETNFSAVR